MNYKYEVIHTDENLPLKILFHTSHEGGSIPLHWHDSVELSYVIQGKIDNIYIEGDNFTSEQGDIVIINANAIHTFSVKACSNRKAISLFIPYQVLVENFPDMEQLTVMNTSSALKDEEKTPYFEELRKHLDSLLKKLHARDQDTLSHIKVKALFYEIMYIILKYFTISNSSIEPSKSKKHQKRLTEITCYIKEHYQLNLSVKSLAEKFGLSAEHLSRFFQKYMGMTLLQYINVIRLEHAYRDLINSDQSITTLAYEHGFPNEKSFTRVFKATYGMSPNEYRKYKIKGKSPLR